MVGNGRARTGQASSFVVLFCPWCGSRCIPALPIFFGVIFSFSTLLLFFSLILLRFRPLVQSPGHSDGWDGNGMKRRGKMRLDTSTAPEMGEREKSVETPFSRCLFLGLPGEGVTTTGPHTTTSSAECLNCRLEFESRVSDLWSRPGPTRSDLARACNVYA